MCWHVCDTRRIYVRSVPDEEVQRLERLAARDRMSVSAVAVRELEEASRRADNPALLGTLPDLDVDPVSVVAHRRPPPPPPTAAHRLRPPPPTAAPHD